MRFSPTQVLPGPTRRTRYSCTFDSSVKHLVSTSYSGGRSVFFFLIFLYCSYKACIQVNRHQYPILFRMAMDYLPVMASAVPCERVFSASAETDVLHRSRISPGLMSALQFLKYSKRNSDSTFRCSISLPRSS